MTLALELCSSASFAQKFLENNESYYSTGYYYLPDSTKISGLIKYTFLQPGYFRFKESLTAKAVTITADECIGFHEDGDKADFETLSNVKIPAGLTNRKLSKCFAELRIAGNLNLYLVYFEKSKPGFSTAVAPGISVGTSSVAGGPPRVATSRYMLKKKNSDVVQEVPKKAKQFRKEIAAFLSDKPGIVDFINSHDYTDDEIEMVVQAYNHSK
ncbi:hypothetical protein SAMN05660461_4930 [Chitinophaga ginsengisegetis]|uniref:Uncharacterized protein n=2 Tax=Chitinophaga ginsengisegetis TaxID=393003 RepID=A0A1T5P8P7_9BACT|nr:hypothetical protein SAMN05660461_4930 [Chitinophaga ginsengisegetis]